MGTWRKVPVETPEGVREGIAPLVLSASRATDIPAFYLEWFLERLDAGYVRWRNPFGGAEQFVSLRDVRACAFWTKNPAPLLAAAERLEARFPFVVQITVNDYEAEGLEPGVPPLAERLGAFVRLSRRIGRERVIWRFDPLLLGGGLSAERLLAKVEAVGEALAPATEQLVFSFADVAEYRKVRAALDRARLPFRAPTEDEMHRLAEGIGALCRKWGLRGPPARNGSTWRHTASGTTAASTATCCGASHHTTRCCAVFCAARRRQARRKRRGRPCGFPRPVRRENPHPGRPRPRTEERTGGSAPPAAAFQARISVPTAPARRGASTATPPPRPRRRGRACGRSPRDRTAWGGEGAACHAPGEEGGEVRPVSTNPRWRKTRVRRTLPSGCISSRETRSLKAYRGTSPRTRNASSSSPMRKGAPPIMTRRIAGRMPFFRNRRSIFQYLSHATEQLFRGFRQVREEPPCRDHGDGSGGKPQLGHGLTQSHRLPFPRLRVRQRLAHLDQQARPAAHRDDEIDLPAGPGYGYSRS